MSNLWIDITANDTVTLHRPNDKGKGYQDMRIVLSEQEAIRLADYLNMWLGRLADSKPVMAGVYVDGKKI